MCLTLATGLAVRATCDAMYIDTLRYLCNHYLPLLRLTTLNCKLIVLLRTTDNFVPKKMRARSSENCVKIVVVVGSLG